MQIKREPPVVNCFQIIIFVLTRTAQHVQRPMLQSIRSIVRNKKMLFFKTRGCVKMMHPLFVI